MENCIFCKIVEGKIPVSKVYEDEKILIFLDIAPVNPGHVLIIPKRHYPTLLELPEEEVKEFMHIVYKAAHAVVKAMEADGFNVIVNNKESAGQVVPHLHFHIIPRFPNDHVQLKWPSKKYKEGQMVEVQKRIKKLL